MKSRQTSVLLIFLGVLLAACGRQGPTTGASPSAVASGSASATAVQNSPNSGILAFNAPKLGGGQVIGSEFQGSDLAIWFWAPW